MAVMNIQRGTQTWSSAEQNAAPRDQGPKNNTTAASSNGPQQPVGDLLNKLVDPNWVDPSKKVRAVGNDQLDKDAFFKMMLAQMKNQDPTNPLKSHEMAAQLAQFSSLEQLHNINTSIEGLAKAQGGQGNFAALQFIGKKVSGDSSKISRVAGDTEHGYNFTLAADAAEIKVEIKDAQDKIVRTIETGGMKKGENLIKWNGIMDDGLPARAGEYKVQIQAKDATGKKIFANSAFEGRITGVNFTPQGPMMLVNGQPIRLSDIKKIEDAGMEAMTPSTPLGVTQRDPRLAMPQAQRTVPKIEKTFIPAAEEAGAQPMNLDQIPMEGELFAKLGKELK
jgi:flagellar basal-body rod modification protein FlgD